MKRHELDPWIEGYLEYLRDVRRIGRRTIIDIRCTLARVSQLIEEIRPGKTLWQASLDDYLAWLNIERTDGRSNQSLAKNLSHLRGLLDYAWRSGRSDRNVLDGFSLQDSVRASVPRTLSLEEAKLLVRAYGRKNRKERRDRLIVLLLYGCGLRTSELCKLDVRDVDLERQEVFVREGKGGRQRRIPVPEAVWTELLAYMTQRGRKRGPLFQTEAKRKRVSSRDIGDVVRLAVQRAQLEGVITPKTLRHAFATHLMDQGVDLAVISSLMGHRSPNETGVYLHVLAGKKEAAVRKLSGTERAEQ